MSILRFTFHAFVLAALAFASSSSSAEDLFRHGFDAYTIGANDEAAQCFRELATNRPASGVLHNLGNAEWKRGQTGEAILAWERAQWLNPFAANTRANLRFARQTAQLPAPPLTWFEICSTWLPVNAWSWLAMGSFWMALALVMLPGIFSLRKADWHQAVAAAGFAVFLLTIPALIGVHSRARLGVIRAPDTALRLTPTREAQTLGKLPAGEVARLERARGPYVYVRTGNDAAGWVDRAQFGRISQAP